MREQGRICAISHTSMDPGQWPGGERRCDRCGGNRRVYLTFFLRDGGWVCSFVEEDARTPVGRMRQFAGSDKLRELIARTPTRLDSAARQALEYAIAQGRGGLFLELTALQYSRLKA
jgi:hypothetical protein